MSANTCGDFNLKELRTINGALIEEMEAIKRQREIAKEDHLVVKKMDGYLYDRKKIQNTIIDCIVDKS